MAILSVMTGVSTAAIISVGGDMTTITVPSSVEPGMQESSSTIWAFEERQAYTLGSGLSVDELVGASVAGVISAGTVVNSYFLHADPIGSSDEDPDIINLTGTITFDSKILGLIWGGVACENCPSSSMYLDASDYLGLSSTLYPTGGLGRGYEVDEFYAVNGTQDSVTISTDGYSLTTVSSAAYPLYSDQLRVITAVMPVPLPLPIWLFGSGLVMLLGFSRKRMS